jgi:hypothetical protein
MLISPRETKCEDDESWLSPDFNLADFEGFGIVLGAVKVYPSI